MKTIQGLFVLALMLLSIDTVSAQYGNNGYGGGGYGGNGYGGGGYGRNNQMSQIPQSQDKPKEIPVEVTIGKIMEKLKPELNLDALQEIAIANVLTESIRSQGILMKAETGQEQKIKEIQALSETTDRKINQFLNEDQKVKYKALNEESNIKKKSRRNR
jgi:hypothetical protein